MNIRCIRHRLVSPDAGVSLIEIIVSIFLLAIISAALVPIFVQGTEQVARTEQLSSASQMVSSRLDAARSAGDNCGTIAALAGSEAATGGSYSLQRTTTIEPCPGTDGTIMVTVDVRSAADVVLATAVTRIYVATQAAPADRCSAPHSTAANSIELGSAFGYSLLSSAAITNAGASVYPGAVGVGPGGALTGMEAAVTVCPDEIGSPAAIAALDDLRTAYAFASDRLPTAILAGDLAGQTLGPGIYRSGAALAMSTTLVFDAGNNPDAVFIIQTPAAVNTAAASNMILANGAKSSNIFWQVGGAVTLGADSHFVGTILGNAAITLGAGTSVDGRALTAGGAITASDNTFGPSGEG